MLSGSFGLGEMNNESQNLCYSLTRHPPPPFLESEEDKEEKDPTSRKDKWLFVFAPGNLLGKRMVQRRDKKTVSGTQFLDVHSFINYHYSTLKNVFSLVTISSVNVF